MVTLRYGRFMRAVKARVKNGRLVLSEPTSLPEGTEVSLVVVESNRLSTAERQQIEAEIEIADDEIARGAYVDALEFADQLLNLNEASTR